TLHVSRWLSTGTEFETSLLAATLAPEELPLAFFPLDLVLEVQSRWLGTAPARAYLLMTDSRNLLVAASIVGDQYFPAGKDTPGELVNSAQMRILGDGRVQLNDHVWKERRASRIAKLIQCSRVVGMERVLEV